MLIYSDEKLAEIANRTAGRLESTPYAVVLTALAVQQASVVLDVARSSVVRSIALDHGVPVDCRTNTMTDSLGQMLISRGKLTDEKRNEYWEKAQTKGKRFGEFLVEEGILDADELARLLQQSLAKKLLGPFAFLDGDYEIHPEPPNVDQPLKVKVPQLVLMGIASYARQEQVDGAVGALVGRKLGLHPTPFFPLDDLKLPQVQLQVVNCLEKRQRLDELAISTGIDLEELTRLIYALCILRVVATEDQLPKKTGPFQAAARITPQAGTPLGPSPSPGAPAPYFTGHTQPLSVVPPQPNLGYTQPIPVPPRPADYAPRPPGSAPKPAFQTKEYVSGQAPNSEPYASRAPGDSTPPVRFDSTAPPAPQVFTRPAQPMVEYVGPGPAPEPPVKKVPTGTFPAGTFPAGTYSAPATPLPPTVPEPQVRPPFDPEVLREEIMRTYNAFLKQDAIDILRVTEDATPAEIDDCFLAFSKKFSPWTIAAYPELRPLASKSRDLFLAGARAYAEISDSGRFAAMVQRRKAAKVEAAPKNRYSQRLAIKTDLLDPAAQFKKAQELMASDKHREAVAVLEFVCDCEPENALYRAELAWCHYLSAPVVPSQPLRDLAEVQRMDPGCGVAFYYAGEIARRAGRFDEAEKHLKAAERLMPRDPRPAESLKQLPRKR